MVTFDVPLPAPGPERARLADEQLSLARTFRVSGEKRQAKQILISAIQGGLWRYARLWTELRSLMDDPSDYHRIRQLWWSSPHHCHTVIPLLSTVARAAAIAGEHDEARMLARKAILIRAQRNRGARHRIGSLAKPLLPTVFSGRQADEKNFDDRAGVALTALNGHLSRMGVRGFLISGTLLGLMRNRGFISWDKDIDLGFFTSEISPSDLTAEFESTSDFNVRRLDFNTDRLRVNHSNGMMIDVFPHYMENDRVWHDGTATRWWNRPFDLTTVSFCGQSVYVPDPPENYLDDNYGDWQIPDPNFDARLDAPNVEVTDQEFLHTLYYFALLSAVSKKNVTKIERYRRHLTALGEGSWLRRL